MHLSTTWRDFAAQVFRHRMTTFQLRTASSKYVLASFLFLEWKFNSILNEARGADSEFRHATRRAKSDQSGKPDFDLSMLGRSSSPVDAVRPGKARYVLSSAKWR